ncbi:hypothetical protein H6F95_01115 [Cyanobacteria bacterium FACHB-471]|nr:hypothetical protein [Cyanobacteria bacterium FACHB-471]
MGVRFKSLLGTLALVASFTAIADVASAQEVRGDVQTLPEAFERAFFRNDRSYYENRSLFRQANYILGQGSIIQNGFPENEITRDANLVNRVYDEALAIQSTSDPLIRTADLPTPYTTSLQLLPVQAPQTTPSTSFSTPPVQSAPFSTPVAVPAAPGPVPALW